MKRVGLKILSFRIGWIESFQIGWEIGVFGGGEFNGSGGRVVGVAEGVGIGAGVLGGGGWVREKVAQGG